MAVDSTAFAIADYHVNVQGWEGIGYHWLVHQNGEIDYVGDIATSRANVALINDEVVGICLPGNWTEQYPPAAALASAATLVAWLRTLLPQAKVVGHYEVAQDGWSTSCPGPLWPRWKPLVVR